MVEDRILDSYPLSPMQKAMFFQSRLSPDSGVYLLQLRGVLLEELNTALFWQAWRKVIERHSILRTSFHLNRQGEPFQVVHSKVEAPIVEQDLRHLPLSEQEIQIQQYLQSDWGSGFNLASPPLLRLALFRLAESKFFFIRAIHHLLSDSRSSFIQYQEAFSIYETLCRGLTPVLLPARKYREYIDWLEGQDLRGAEVFWRNLLKGFHTPTPLVSEKRNPDAGSPAGDSAKLVFGLQSRRISIENTKKLQVLVKEYSFTMNTLLQAAWGILLARYSGEEDVVFGGTRNCRKSSFPGAEELVGPMVNTLPVRALINSHQNSVSLMRDLRQQWLAMRPYEHCPLTDIFGWSEIPSGIRLFESVVNYDHMSFNQALRALSDKWQQRTFEYRQNPGYSLALNGYGEDQFLMQIYYDRSLYDDSTIQRMLAHLEVLLLGMQRSPDRPVTNLPVITEEERKTILSGWNSTAIEFQNKQLVHQLFEEQAQKSPEQVAVVWKDQRMTYGQLNQRAGQLAGYLRNAGVAPGRIVAIHLQRSPMVIVAALAILKAGGAFLPLDPESPVERLNFMLNDAQPVMALTQQNLLDKRLGSPSPLFVLDRDGRTLQDIQPSGSATQPTPQDLAYVIYTSGSTGVPKGVEIAHSGLSNLVAWHIREFSITDQDRATQLANLAFDGSVWEIWPYLAAGAQVHLLADEIDLAPDRLISWYSRAGITISFLPTPLLESVLDQDWSAGLAPRIILTGGDRLHRRPPEGLPFRLINNYGPTECTVVATSGEVLPSRNATGGNDELAPDIGRPISNTETYVLDHHLNPLPVGVPGELFVGGAGLARGYLNREDLTAERFIANPFSSSPGARLYKTGDLVRYLPDGRLEYLGRIDTQVKVRGVRIELGEIETLLQAYPGIARGVVVAVDDRKGGLMLVAFLENDDSFPVDMDELGQFLRAKLPAQMIPAEYRTIDEFPITPNQKIDRQVLEKLALVEQSPTGSGKAKLTARDALEEAMAGLWAEVLGLPAVGVRDNFFDYGGNSLLGIRLVSLINDIFEVELPLKSLFDSPTVEGINTALKSKSGRKYQDLLHVAELFLMLARIPEAEAERMLEEKIIQQQMWDRDTNPNE